MTHKTEFHKARGKLNVQIGLILGAIVILIMIGSVSKFTQNKAINTEIATEKAKAAEAQE